MLDKFKCNYAIRLKEDGSNEVVKVGKTDKKLARALNCAVLDLLAIPIDLFSFDLPAYMIIDIFAVERGRNKNDLASILNDRYEASDGAIFGDVIIVPGKRDALGQCEIAPAPKEVAQIMCLQLLAWNEVMR